jgi:hypothetical protein
MVGFVVAVCVCGGEGGGQGCDLHAAHSCEMEVCSWGTLVRYQGAVMLWGSVLVIWVASGWDDCHDSCAPGAEILPLLSVMV